jgi:hypothetical protein
MPSVKKTLRMEAGVSLTEVILTGAGGVVAVAYTVKSKRTLEVPNFETLAAAEQYFDAEVQRCSKPHA